MASRRKKKPIIVARAHEIAKPAASSSSPSPHVALPPTRVHSPSYHRPLLCTDNLTCGKLLSWYEHVQGSRSMPWRKPWIDPESFGKNDDGDGDGDELRYALARRAYEVWVSEVMLQQTRVSTVIPYFNNWISKWPTVQDLAEAEHDEVLAAWKGLGYYSRATRLHEGAKAMIAKAPHPASPIPALAVDLQNFPGIGRYTAGAISSIAFGRAEPVLDGNVARVLSRQLGLYVQAKDKKATDVLWEAADRLVKHVSQLSHASQSDVPGQWNQALMELGSTVCTPRPRCGECPIQATCRVFKEGQALCGQEQGVHVAMDVEDVCLQCEPLDPEDLEAGVEEQSDAEEQEKHVKKIKSNAAQSNTISRYFTSQRTQSHAQLAEKEDDEHEQEQGQEEKEEKESRKRKHTPSSPSLVVSKTTLTYCSLFPKKTAKKQTAQQACVVCMIELCSPDGGAKWLIEKRPAKGLLASLWQFPQSTLPRPQSTDAQRKTAAQEYVSSLEISHVNMGKARLVASFPALLHVFTHLKLTMHPFQYKIIVDHDQVGGSSSQPCTRPPPPVRKWVDANCMDDETLSTGMRRCWELVAKGERESDD